MHMVYCFKSISRACYWEGAGGGGGKDVVGRVGMGLKRVDKRWVGTTHAQLYYDIAVRA